MHEQSVSSLVLIIIIMSLLSSQTTTTIATTASATVSLNDLNQPPPQLQQLNYHYTTSLNSTANSKSLYYSPKVFFDPCKNNTTPYPCFNKILLFTTFTLFPNNKVVSFGNRGFNLCHYYESRLGWNASKCYSDLCSNNSTSPFFQQYCMLCNVVSNEFRWKMWNVSECPTTDRRIDLEMTQSADYDQNQICGSAKSSPLLFYVYQQRRIVCYCEEEDFWASNCSSFRSSRLAYYSYHYIIIILSFLVSVLSLVVLLVPTLIQSRVFKKVRHLNHKLNHLVRVACGGGNEGFSLSGSKIYLPKKAFAFKHFLFLLNLLVSLTSIGYFASRLALFIAQDFVNYMTIMAIVFFLITISSYTICILWINSVFNEIKKKHSEDTLTVPLRVIYIVGLILMALVLAAYVITRMLSQGIGSGIILLVFMSILIVLGLAILFSGLKLFHDLVKLKKGSAESFVTLKFTRFIMLIVGSFIVLCILLVIFSLENMGVNFIRGDLGLAIEFIIELVMIWILALLVFYLYNHESNMDTYEFVYWPLVMPFRKLRERNSRFEPQVDNKT